MSQAHRLAVEPGSVSAWRRGFGATPMGIFAGVDGNTLYIVVVTQGADVWRAIPAESTMQQPWTWTQLATGIGTAGNIAQHCPIIGDQPATCTASTASRASAEPQVPTVVAALMYGGDHVEGAAQGIPADAQEAGWTLAGGVAPLPP